MIRTDDPYPLLEKAMRVVPSKDVLPVDLDDPNVFDRPDLDLYSNLTVHWGGGPNPAGEPIEAPELSWWQKWGLLFGRVRSVLTSWHNYHRSKGMAAIAYCTAIPTTLGTRIVKLRGHRWNGGQWGRINGMTHAVVFIHGYGQVASEGAWRALGLLWFAMGAPKVVGHRDWNDHPDTQTTTSCPGDLNMEGIRDRKFLSALGVLRYRPGNLMGNVRVKVLTQRLAELGYLERKQRRYLRNVEDAVAAFQSRKGLTVDGIVGPVTWEALAKL